MNEELRLKSENNKILDSKDILKKKLEKNEEADKTKTEPEKTLTIKQVSLNTENNKINNNNEVVDIRRILNNVITRKQEQQSNNKNNNYFDNNCLDTFSDITNRMMYISTIPNIIFLIGIMISYKKNKNCNSKIYSLDNIIELLIFIYQILLIPSGLIEMFKLCCLERICCRPQYCLFILSIYLILTKLCLCIISFALIIIIQSNMPDSWDNCGSYKGWVMYGLIIFYITSISLGLNIISLMIYYYVHVFGSIIN